MNLIGLTGGIGMGKSTSARLLGERGLPVIDTDVVAREVVEPGLPAWEEVRRAFGEGVIGPEGRLRRDELARLVFSDIARRKQLEAILHPRIRERWVAQAEAWRGAGVACGVVVIPLLFETEAASAFGTIVCVACSAASQRQRLLGRGWSLEQVQQRIQAQWPVEKKIALAHHVIWTEGDLESHAQQIELLLRGWLSAKVGC